MSCIYPNKLSPDNLSELHKNLVELYATQKEADDVLNLIETQEFKKKFGDWEVVYKSGSTEMAGRVYPTGEPELKFNANDVPYFEQADGEKFFLRKRLLNFDHKTREKFVDLTMYQLFRDNVEGDLEAFEGVNINSIFTNTGKGTIYSLMKGNMVDLQDIKKLVINRLQLAKVKVKEKEDYNEDEGAVSREESENTKGLDLQTSQEKNSKDNATANIKLLMSFIPTTDANGVPMFAKFDAVWKKIEPVLAGTVDLFNNGIVLSRFDIMMSKLEQAYPNDHIIEQLVDTVRSLPSYKQNEFVQALDKIKVNYQTSLVDKKQDGSITYKFFDSNKAVTPEKRIKNTWLANFKGSDLFKLDNDGKPLFDEQLANKLLNGPTKGYNVFQVKVGKTKMEAQMDENLFIELKHRLDFIGVNLSENALRTHIGSFNTDPNPEFLTNANLLSAVTGIKYLFTSLANLKQADVVNGYNINNVFNNKEFKTRLEGLAKFQAEFNQDLTENTIMGAESKKYWIYSLPSYMDLRFKRLFLDTKSELPSQNGFYGNSILLQKYRDILADPAQHKQFFEKFRITMFNNFREENVGDEGTDNSGMTEQDQLVDQINKALTAKRGGSEVSSYYTPSPADKSRMMQIEGSHFYSSHKFDNAAELSDDVTRVFTGYLVDELTRIQQNLELIQDTEANKDRLYKDYHFHIKDGSVYYYGIPIAGKPNKYDYVTDPNTKGAVLVGNAFKSVLFPEFSPFNQSDAVKQLNIFNTKGELQINPQDLFGNSEKAVEVKRLIDQAIQNVITVELQNLRDKNLIVTKDNKLQFRALDTTIMSKYQMGSDLDNVRAAVSDYVVNSMISNVEFSKVFSGDYAFYKDLSDLSKRYPFTYTDGIQMNLKEGDNPTYKLAVLPNIMLPSYALDEIRAYSPSLAKAYANVNATDAQGYITLDRWKFVMERSNHWNPKFEEAYQRIKDGVPTKEDYYLAAQPIKGTHFEIVNGVPTGIKYSAAVLIPAVVKGTSLGKLHDDMIAQGVSEAVVVDGIKVGAKVPSDVLNTDGTYKTTTLNTITLRNNYYKIQQDLRPKGIKQTLIGSQLKKVILTNFQDNEMYGDILGKDLKQEFFDILSTKSEFGLQKLQKDLGIDATGNILDKSKLIQSVIKRISDRGITDNLLSALEREYDFDYIANYRQKIQNALMASINDATVNVKTNGAAFIQMSSWGLNEEDVKYSGIKLLVDDFKALKPPVVKSTFQKLDTNNTVSFGDFKIDVNIGPDTLITPIIVNGKTIGEVGISFSNWVTLDSRNNDESKLPDSTTFKSKEVFISGVEIYEEFKNKGFGKEAYKELINKLGEKGFYINSGINTSDEAKRVWDSLVRDNIATLNKNEYSTKDLFKKKVTPGQVFVSSNYIAKFIPNWKSIPADKLKGMIDSRLLKMIGYRIPNQGMSSNVSLEIVGILPESYGDTIIPYIDITTQMGSDFDIDKLYTLIPAANPIYNKKTTNEIISDLMQLEQEELIQILEDNSTVSQAYLDQLTKNTKKAKENLAREIVLNGYFSESQLSFVPSVERLEYVEYNPTKSPLDNSQKAVDNRLIELMQIILEDEKTYDSLMSPLDNPFLKDDIDKLHGSEEGANLGTRFFSPVYQISKKFDNSGGKSGVGLTANQLTDHMWTQHSGLTFTENIGFTNPKDGVTSFDGEYDILGENKITDVLSWFLTAYVDIAKDPYITKGNHNEYTSNTTFMLLRGGAPISFINRLVGQTSIKKLAELDSLRKSRISDVDRRKLKDAVIEELGLNTNLQYNDAETVIDRFNNSGDIKKAVKAYNERLEKDILNPNPTDPKWIARQLEYLDLYLHYHEIGQKFASTVLSSKQDVNGGGKDPIAAQVDRNRRAEASNQGFLNFENKFNGTFLGTAYKNSTELSMKLMEQLFVTSNKSAQVLYDGIFKLVSPKSKYGLTDPKLGFEMEKAYFAHILGQSGMARTSAEIKDMFTGNNSVYDKVLKVRKDNPNNYFLNLLDIKQQDNLKFVVMDSTKNNTPEALNEISRGWEDLFDSDIQAERELAKELMIYSFYQSGFRSNIGSFFEHIPTDQLVELVEAGISDAKSRLSGGTNGYNQFVDKFFRNNYQNDRLVPYAASKLKNGKPSSVTGVLTVEVDTGTERNKHLMPYLKTKSGDAVKLWKNVGFRTDDKGKITEAKFIEVPKLGYSKNGLTIYEYSKDIAIDGDSMLPSNNSKASQAVINAVAKAGLEDYNAIELEQGDDIPNNTRDQDRDMDQANEDGLTNCTPE